MCYYYCGPEEFPSDGSEPDEPNEPEYIDRDTYKSCLPSGTIIATAASDTNKAFDMKAHETDERDVANQLFLANDFASKNGKRVHVVASFGIYPRRDLMTTENGSLQTLTWKNLSIKVPGVIYAVCYNQTDGVYILTGTVDATGKATFPGFIMRDATQVSVFVLE